MIKKRRSKSPDLVNPNDVLGDLLLALDRLLHVGLLVLGPAWVCGPELDTRGGLAELRNKPWSLTSLETNYS